MESVLGPHEIRPIFSQIHFFFVGVIFLVYVFFFFIKIEFLGILVIKKNVWLIKNKKLIQFNNNF